ncbi:citrate/2-methylcitrate synthase [Candidatus Contubernalis alkaliaceticus]|uniref:citrate/2-methylcitrate synthase n=1 Tax=Candidatus Contubernalis alkaliaceticus TaxID=338645 RepID=UPI001F4C1383|nr:citrate/2-methylcitrate synthase [Candidatus Contubernalis alkalaceticus]UNC91615.1 citrate/2-methylcitrate synthase [Candidatus Contubernalis alkalaceticus]
MKSKLDIFVANETFFNELSSKAQQNNQIDPQLYKDSGAKQGLRNVDGTGVLIGFSKVGEVQAYSQDDNGEKIPMEGRLFYRGIEITDLVKGYQNEQRHGFEEVCYLLLFGSLPNKNQLLQFKETLGKNRTLPDGFTEDMILKAPSSDIMNKLARNVLTCYSYDSNPEDNSLSNVLRQSIELIAEFPTMSAYGYQAKVHFYDQMSLFIHIPDPELSTSENFLHLIRPNNRYTKLEAEVLDLCLVLHAEHGGGNNSTFTARVVTSTDTDTYSAIAAAVGSLKGPKHGGANIKVTQMMEDIKQNVKDWNNEKELEDYLAKIIKKEAFDRTGLLYGIGHAVYTLSDPRAILLKEKAKELAKEKHLEEEFNLYCSIEKLAPQVFSEINKDVRTIVPNVDFYSGFVYKMLNIPLELYTPIFAMSRVAGWCAHRIEELVNSGKIIRPAYKNIIEKSSFIPLEQRT